MESSRENAIKLRTCFRVEVGDFSMLSETLCRPQIHEVAKQIISVLGKCNKHMRQFKQTFARVSEIERFGSFCARGEIPNDVAGFMSPTIWTMLL